MRFDPTLPEDGLNVSRTHPLADLAQLLGGAVGVAAALFVLLLLLANLLIPLVPPAWETEHLASLVPTEFHDDARQVPLQALLDRLVVHLPARVFDHRVAVLESPEPNALAFPGGLIVVTTGLLDGLRSENELAMLLGHELGHYAGRDHLEGLGRALSIGLVGGILSLGSGGSSLSRLFGELTLRDYGREQERAADAYGLGLVFAEYGHVAGATAFFERLPKTEDRLAERLKAKLATHPVTPERIADLVALADARGWPREGTLSPFRAPEAARVGQGALQPDSV